MHSKSFSLVLYTSLLVFGFGISAAQAQIVFGEDEAPVITPSDQPGDADQIADSIMEDAQSSAPQDGTSVADTPNNNSIPEPLTIFASATALGVGSLMRKRYLTTHVN